MRQRGIATGWLYLIGILAIIGSLTWIAAKIKESGRAEIRLEWAEANRLQREAEAKKSAEAATKLETGNVKAKVVYREITKTVDKYIDRPVYRNVCFDADGLRDANAALRGPSAPAAKPDKPLPKP